MLPEADVDGLPPATEVDRLIGTPGGGTNHEEPVGEYQDDILRRVKALRAGGSSLRAIAVKFNDEGVATLSGKGRWGSSTLSRLLRRSDSAIPSPLSEDDLPPAA